MVMSVVRVWEVWVLMDQRLMPVLMTVFDTGSHWIVMLMQMMLVMDMLVTMHHLFMLVPVHMAFG